MLLDAGDVALAPDVESELGANRCVGMLPKDLLCLLDDLGIKLCFVARLQRAERGIVGWRIACALAIATQTKGQHEEQPRAARNVDAGDHGGGSEADAMPSRSV